MKTTLKVIMYLALGFVGLFIVAAIFGSYSAAEADEKEEELKKVHCEMNWTEMETNEKKKALEEFAEEHGFGANLGGAASKGIKMSVKYPETVTIDGEKLQDWMYFSQNEISIIDVEEGILRYHKNFLAKNKLNMDVRSRMTMDIKYNAGCKGFEVVDFKVE